MSIHSIVSSYRNGCIDDSICETILVFILSSSRRSLSRSKGREEKICIHFIIHHSKDDLSNLDEVVQLARSQPERTQQIALQGQDV